MKAILVTRPRHQADSFVKELEQYGLSSVVFPTIEIRPVSGWQVPDLSHFDGIFFTSTNSVAFFMERLTKENPGELENLQRLNVWAVGKSTSQLLGDYGVKTRPVPKIADAATLMEEIDSSEITGKTFLFLRGNLSLGIIPDIIGKRGGKCVELTVYENIPPSLEETGNVKKLLESGGLSCISFTSPSTAVNFFEAMGSTALPEGVLVAAIGTTTAGALEKLGIRTDIIPEYFDSPNFAKAIAGALGRA
ncbi:MAG: uroporphyrinogen-III synthase [Chlorobiaceae bacterium]|nr:uroporphyrinogen-III synthase [Chlorobiaceae bacterium]NTV60061.1 uroporphyrinogen-III synthase [Chlorobiaceae bacterium]